ncbi:(2Fe-2S)-binding protein [Caballeronia sp. AZ7_KS35]|uniref:(2Fe-2S)-binding protein n=1 Tax=Caballeronia sp. AZ7_KS35 TaxID=2921762 RepID=UPI0020298E71|nr:(2Fe-2S)-binding protein [Caballeronia sp. AZ7_KS35]
MSGFVRLDERQRAPVNLTFDGNKITALEGDTLLVALRVNGKVARQSEFGDGPRAGFCMMGACQDCWVTLADGRRTRACTTVVENGMAVLTRWPEEL